MPVVAAGGRLRIRVQPEVTAPRAAAISSTRIETELDLANGQPFLVTATGMPGEPPSLMERLFSGRLKEASNRELVVVVTPRLVGPAYHAASAIRASEIR